MDAVLKEIAADVASTYALDWRNNQVATNMKARQVTEIGVGKSVSLDVANPLEMAVKNILPLYAHVGITHYGKVKYEEFAQSRARAQDQLLYARGVNENDKVASTVAYAAPMLNKFFNALAGTNKKETTEADKTDQEKKTAEYCTVSGDTILLDPALLKLDGVNVSVLQNVKPYIGSKEGKLIIPNILPVMLHTTYGAKGAEYDLIIGSVGG